MDALVALPWSRNPRSRACTPFFSLSGKRKRRSLPSTMSSRFPSSTSRGAMSNPTTPVARNSSPDDLFVSFGSSVNVSEDLRRSIRTEIEEIDASIGSLQSNVQNEQRNQNQLTKDLSHAKSEISNLRRGASDELDSATMNQQVRNRLAETLKVELVSAIVSPTSSCEAISESDSDTEEKMDDSIAEGQGAHSKRKSVSLKSYLGTNFSEVKRLTYKIREDQKEGDTAEKETRSIEDEHANVVNRMARNNSENLLGIAEKEVQSRKKEQDAEAHRKRSTQEVIQRARQRCGQYAQQIADRTKALSAEKTKNASEEANMISERSLCEDEIRNMSDTQISLLEKTLETVTTQLENLVFQCDDAETMKKQIVAAENELKEVEIKAANLGGMEEVEKKLVVEAKTKANSAETAYTEVKKLEASLLSYCEFNNKIEAEQVIPAKEELVELLKEKERLAGVMGEFHASSVSDKAERKVDLEAAGAKIVSLKEGLKGTDEEIETIKTERQTIGVRLAALNEARDKEIEENRSFCLKFEEATKAEQTRLEELLESRKSEHKKKIDELRSEGAKTTNEYNLKLEIVNQGSKIIDTTEDAESKLRDSPIQLNDDGEDVSNFVFVSTE
eukprot:scaffold3445_cov57-Attheya_sp.AAC.4